MADQGNGTGLNSEEVKPKEYESSTEAELSGIDSSGSGSDNSDNSDHEIDHEIDHDTEITEPSRHKLPVSQTAKILKEALDDPDSNINQVLKNARIMRGDYDEETAMRNMRRLDWFVISMFAVCMASTTILAMMSGPVSTLPNNHRLNIYHDIMNTPSMYYGPYQQTYDARRNSYYRHGNHGRNINAPKINSCRVKDSFESRSKYSLQYTTDNMHWLINRLLVKNDFEVIRERILRESASGLVYIADIKHPKEPRERSIKIPIREENTFFYFVQRADVCML